MRSEPVTLSAGRVLLRPFRVEEIDEQWQAMVGADEIERPRLPDEAAFRAHLERSGRMVERRLDLAIDVGGRAVGRIQTFLPPDRVDQPSTYNIGIVLHPPARGQGYGAEALAAFTRWLFETAGATRVEGRTDPRNHPMQRVFRRLGWTGAGTVVDSGREWLLFTAPAPPGRGRG